MAHWDGRSDEVESSVSQEKNGMLIKQAERGDNLTDERPVSGIDKDDTRIEKNDVSWTVIQSEDTSGGSDPSVCFIGNIEDYQPTERFQTNNSIPAFSSAGFAALSLFPNSVSSETSVKEYLEQNQSEQVTDTDLTHDVLAPSDLNSSVGSRCSAIPDYHCETCAVIESKLHSQESIDFWKCVPRKGLDESSCHEKFLEKFIEKLKEFSCAKKLLKDSKVENLLKTLLKVNLADDTAVVKYENFARLVKFLGPVGPSECVMLQQISHIKEASIVKDTSRKEKLSWFAGDMTREDATAMLINERCGTYLVRMSQTSVVFVVSVKHEDGVEHVEISGDYINALSSRPYDASLSLNRRTYTSLVDAVNSLKTNPLTIIEDDESDEESDVMCQRAEKSFDIFCRYCCPNLPLNGILSGYKRTRR
ncbi:uncharacterized protein LOC132543781 [Ylistrum balloti]|uniref:uncharacterized protein LOC132543781 n=1 Tax=Ylistrum balloti TaxID=509963 RepID=UPI002905BCE4|nr:uncharacterized protein LOC132543781 [Ylistrum balloti]